MIGPLFRLVALASLPLAPPCAGERCTVDTMIVFDGAGAMAEMGFNQIGTPRISEARKALRKALPPIAAMRRLGLVIYGPGQDQTCGTIDLRFAPQWKATGRIQKAEDALRPAGGTPGQRRCEWRLRPAITAISRA